MKTEFVDTSHGRIAFSISDGTGMPLLMLHGNSTCKEAFQKQFRSTIGTTFRCVAVDLPGHGASTDAVDPDRTYNTPGYASAAVEVMHKLEIPEYAVFGWSLGGHIALDMLAQTEALTGVMISGTPPIGTGPNAITEGFFDGIDWSLASKRVFSHADALDFATACFGDDDPQLQFFVEKAMRTDGRARALMLAKLACCIGPTQAELAVNSKVPLAIVNGEDDAFINNDYISKLPYENIWQDGTKVLPGIGHSPFWEDSDAFDRILNRFIGNL